MAQCLLNKRLIKVSKSQELAYDEEIKKFTSKYLLNLTYVLLLFQARQTSNQVRNFRVAAPVCSDQLFIVSISLDKIRDLMMPLQRFQLVTCYSTSRYSVSMRLCSCCFLHFKASGSLTTFLKQPMGLSVQNITYKYQQIFLRVKDS